MLWVGIQPEILTQSICTTTINQLSFSAIIFPSFKLNFDHFNAKMSGYMRLFLCICVLPSSSRTHRQAGNRRKALQSSQAMSQWLLFTSVSPSNSRTSELCPCSCSLSSAVLKRQNKEWVVKTKTKS